jgi:hypothetical protein
MPRHGKPSDERSPKHSNILPSVHGQLIHWSDRTISPPNGLRFVPATGSETPMERGHP